VSSLCRSTSP